MAKYLTNVRTIEINTVEDSILYNTIHEDTDKLYLGEKRTERIDKEGKKIIEAEVTRINDIVTDMKITREEIIDQPEE